MLNKQQCVSIVNPVRVLAFHSHDNLISYPEKIANLLITLDCGIVLGYQGVSVGTELP